MSRCAVRVNKTINQTKYDKNVHLELIENKEKYSVSFTQSSDGKSTFIDNLIPNPLLQKNSNGTT